MSDVRQPIRTGSGTSGGRIVSRTVVGSVILMMVVGTGVMVVPEVLVRGAPAVAAPAFATVPHFTVPLPIPAKATPLSPNSFHLTQRQTQQVIHPSLGPTTVWGYDDGTLGTSYPGPTIEVRRKKTFTVSYENQLPTSHLLPVPGEPTVGTLTHLHGGFSLGADDGNPHATPDPYRRGETQTVEYTNDQPPATLWYHDHAEGVTHWNVYAGLAGFFLIRDALDTGREPNPMKVPGGPYEIAIVIQDRTFDEEGQLFYRQFGDTAVVNGAAFPFLEVEPRQYRFRFLNGSNARFYNLEISDGPRFHQIGSHGGLFDAPVLRDQLLIATGERADVIVDFEGFEGETLVLRNLQPAAVALPEIMQFRVGEDATTPGPKRIPKNLRGSLPKFGAPDRERYITLDSTPGTFFPVLLDGRHFSEPVNIRVPVGKVEDWLLIGLAPATHPIHVHPPQFQVVSRRPFDVAAYEAALFEARAAGEPNPDPAPFYTGGPLPLQPNDHGFLDMASVPRGQVVRIRSPFDVPKGARGTQKYVMHCHILEHEDNDMMRPYDVIERPRGRQSGPHT